MIKAIIASGFSGTWCIEIFPWWDKVLRGAIKGFGIPTFGRDEMVKTCVEAVNTLKWHLDEIAAGN